MENEHMNKKAGDYTRKETKERVLMKILEWQETCAPVTIQIGYTDSKMHGYNQEIIVKKCPPAIIEKLTNDKYLKDYIHFSMTEHGLLLEFF